MGSIFTNRSILKFGSITNAWFLKHLGVILRHEYVKLIFIKHLSVGVLSEWLDNICICKEHWEQAEL
jgi:hypothetical protein